MPPTVSVPAKRGGNLNIDPKHLTLLDSGLNGRYKDVTKDQIEAKAASILKHGQLQAVRIGRDEKGKPFVTFGNTRVRALLLINSGWLPDGYSGAKPKLPMVCRCEVGSGKSETALLESIEENRQRNSTTPVDDWHNQQRLKTELNFTDEQIAEAYQCTAPWVAQLRKLGDVIADIRKAVASGQMAVAAAIELAQLDKDAQRKALDSLLTDKGLTVRDLGKPATTETNGHTTTAEVVNSSPEKMTGKGKAKKAKKPAKKAAKPKKKTISAADARKHTRTARAAKGKGGTNRTVKEIKEFFEGLTGPAELTKTRAVAKLIVEFVTGKRDEASMTAAFIAKLSDKGW